MNFRFLAILKYPQMKVTQVALRPTQASNEANRPALTPELLAATGARYSRSNDGLDAINPDKSVESEPLYNIYALRDPRNGEIRYVGITKQTVKKRLIAHLRTARSGAQWHSARWLAQLLEENLRPQIEILERTDDAEREIFWIAHSIAAGYMLTNATSGGISGYHHSTEARAKISEAGQKRFKDLTGQQIGRLTVLEVASHCPLQWLCQCSCGRLTIIPSQSFVSHNVKSCGCLSREGAAERARARAKHGMWQSKEYLAWREMRSRCKNPNHIRYGCNGALGITVCADWQDSFEQFFADIGPKPDKLVLMRKDKNQNYNSQNCVWATRSELRRQK